MTLEEIAHPISFDRLQNILPAKFRIPFKRVVEHGGLLPPKTMKAVVAALSEIDRGLGEKLARLSADRDQLLERFGARQKQNLALQKETLSAALTITGVDTHQILDWVPAPDADRGSFLEGLPGAYVREDVMLSADLNNLPGFAAVRDAPYLAARTFESQLDPTVRVTVVMANRLPLEEQTGADLVYYNEAYKCFVLVQYKALERRNETFEFRWVDGDLFSNEIQRMDDLLNELNAIEPDTNPDGFRFSSNPYFLKFCSRIVFNPDDRGMFPGLYLPHGLWKTLARSGRLRGPLGGNVLTYENVGRRIDTEHFTALVAGAWVGTTITQSASLEAVIRSVLETGRTVTFAVKRRPPPPPDPATVTHILPPLNDGNELLVPELIPVLVERG
jgi:hypothetical protein